MRNKLLLITLAALAVSCAKKESTNNQGSTGQPIPTDGSVYTPNQVAPGYDPGSAYGSAVPLKISSLSTMSEYTGRPMYNPQDIQVNLNVVRYGESFGGTLKITYVDFGQSHQGFFTAGHSAEESRYNVWFQNNGKDVWHGFFEDYIGAVIVVIDGVTDLGDGGSKNKLASGSVWFKNFGVTYAPRPPSWCWFVSLGPYDCRAWKDGKGVNTTQAVNPDNGYKKLGTFSDMDLGVAFNGGL